MATISSKDYYGQISAYKNNPTKAHYKALDMLAQLFGGVEVDMDPSSPFIYALDCTAVNTAICLDEHASVARRLNPTAAITQDDLYTHMSDLDYLGRFALPASAGFMIAIDVRDLNNLLVGSDSDELKQIVIPRNSFFQVGGYTFSLEYPVSIRKYKNSGYAVVYINDKESPLTDISSNNIDYDLITANNGIEYIRFTVATKQFSIDSRQDTISYSNGRYYAFEFQDEFCLARVYLGDAFGQWKEIRTTHSDQVFDPQVPTVLIKVENNTIRFEVPHVYVNNTVDGTYIRGKIRYDVYTTKGKIALDLSTYQPEHFSSTWHAVDNNDWTPQSTVLKEIKNIHVLSTDLVSGGRSSLSFEELKARMMSNALGRQNIPITNAQTNTELIDLGYQVKGNIDVVTNRVFQASKETPSPVDPSLITPASVSMQTLGTNMLQAAQCPGVFDNGEMITLTSKALYKNDNGLLSLVSKQEFDEINSYADAPNKARVINERNYHYSPYYYVLDASSPTFEVRPYHFDTPKIVTKFFEMANDTSSFEAGLTQTYGAFTYFNDENGESGFLIEVRTKSNSNFKDTINLPHNNIAVQLSFIPTNSSSRVYLNANMVAFDPMDNERTYQFKLASKFNVNTADEIEFLNFTNATSDTPVRTGLRTTFDVFIQVAPNISKNYLPTKIDSFANPAIFPGRHVECITWERLDIQFGQPLKNLWCQSRSNVSSVVYQTYPSDVVDVYEHDVYQIDPLTGRLLTFAADGTLNKTKLFSRGEVVKDLDGKPLIKHRKGDIVYDGNAQPIKADNYKQQLTRYLDILLIEGVYYFVNDKIAAAYKNYVRNLQVSWITKELLEFEAVLLEKTKIYFHPKVSSGLIEVLTADNTEENIESAQSLKLTLHVPTTTNKDPKLKESLSRKAVSIIDTEFKKPRVCVSEIEKTLKMAFSDDVYNVELFGITGLSKYPMVTVLNPSARLGIRKRLVATPDGTLTVEEDVSITFKVHGQDS